MHNKNHNHIGTVETKTENAAAEAPLQPSATKGCPLSSAPRSDAPPLHGFPISPFATTSPGPAQPPDHIPVFDSFGAWVSWIPRSGPGSAPTFNEPILFENSRGKSVCWINPKWLEQ